MYLTVYLVSAQNKSNSATQQVETKCKVFAGKDGERFVKFYLIITYTHLTAASKYIITMLCLMYCLYAFSFQ